MALAVLRTGAGEKTETASSPLFPATSRARSHRWSRANGPVHAAQGVEEPDPLGTRLSACFRSQRLTVSDHSSLSKIWPDFGAVRRRSTWHGSRPWYGPRRTAVGVRCKSRTG